MLLPQLISIINQSDIKIDLVEDAGKSLYIILIL